MTHPTTHPTAPPRRTALLWLLAASLPLSARAAGAVALVTDLTGNARARQALEILAELQEGDELRLDAGSRLSLSYLGTGQQFELSGPARARVLAQEVQVLSGAPALRRASPLASASLRLNAPARPLLAQGAIRMRSAPTPAPRLLAPVGRLLTPPTEFEWQAPRPLAGLSFELSEAPADRQLLSQEAADSPLPLPAGLALAPGASYAWAIEYDTGRGGRQRLSASFSLAAPEERERWQRLQPPPEAPVADRVVYAQLLAQHGWDGEARRWWRELAALRPDSRALALQGQP